MTSVAWADRQSPVAMLRMKGEAEDALRETGVAHVIIRPSGFFSDMWEVLQMCRRGTFWSFGDAYLNPISPVDLGDFIAEHVLDASRVGPFEVGGPDAYDIPALAALCGRVLEREVRVRRVPMWLARAGVAMIRPFSRNLWEMSDFFIGSSALTHAAGMSALLPKYGTHHREDYLRERLASVGE